MILPYSTDDSTPILTHPTDGSTPILPPFCWWFY